ncbi:MAG: hypothetical protein HY791_38400 [Deltaproteobacteria bacterium]|nr:hypothetical protein [Deltaproteobacteria bacterium]
MVAIDTHGASHEGRVRAYFTRDLGAAEMSSIRDQVRACESCKRMYERYASAESALYASGVSLSAVDRVQRRVLLDGSKPEPRGWLAWTIAAAACAIAVVVVPVLTSLRDDEEQWIARGKPEQLFSSVGMRALAVAGGPPPTIRDLSGDGKVTVGERVRLVASVSPGSSAPVRWVRGVVRGLDSTSPPRELFTVEVEPGSSPVGQPYDVEAWPGGVFELVLIFAESKKALAAVPLGAPAGDRPDGFVRVMRLEVRP